MTRSIAPSHDEEAAVLERARAFAHEENIKIQSVLRTAGATIVTSTPASSSQCSTIPSNILPNLAIFNRIYIGSINFELTDAEIGSVFFVFGPLKSVMMMMDPVTKRHRGYGFLEFETPDGAALALANMDNSELGGRHIKVGRPNNFPADLPPGVPRPLPNRIYVANIHELIQEDEIRAIFEAFGPLRHCNLSPDPKLLNQHRGYGFIEYEVVADAINAMTSLHNFELAGRQLKIGKAVLGGSIPIGMKDAHKLKASPEDLSENSTSDSSSAQSPSTTLQLSKLPSAVLRAAQQINAALGAKPSNSSSPSSSRWGQGPASSTATSNPNKCVMMLCNIVDLGEVEDEQGSAELKEDVTLECEKFGKIAEDIQIHVTSNTQEVRIFVKYSSEQDCSAAILKMDGRWFGGRQISAKQFSVDLYDSRKFE